VTNERHVSSPEYETIQPLGDEPSIPIVKAHDNSTAETTRSGDNSPATIGREGASRGVQQCFRETPRMQLIT